MRNFLKEEQIEGGGGAQRPVLRVNEPEKIGKRSSANERLPMNTEPEFSNFHETQESILRDQFRQPCSLAGRYDNPIPTRFLAPIDCLKIPAQFYNPIVHKWLNG